MDTPNTTGIGSGIKGANVNQAASTMHDKIDKVSEAARPVVDRVTSSAHDAVETIANKASQAADTLEQKAGEYKEMQAKFMESCTSYVQTHPMAALGIAVAAGFLISKMMSSSSSNQSSY
jgi:ElaB/YqjD/DUF883 family membrane-anchored ribosome-binding protein